MFDFLLAVFTWMVSPEKLVIMFKRFFGQKKIHAFTLEERIRSLKLGISNGESMKMRSYVIGRSCVFFPVVPRANLSIIHLVFADAIKGLAKLGLKVKILVFDDYYRRVKKCDKASGRTAVENFISELTALGIDRFDIKLESNYTKKSAFAKKFLHRIMDLCSMKSIDEIRNLREQTSAYTRGEDSYIRQQKIFYNLAYASLFDNIGFVLCGADEVPMWEDFINLEKKIQGGQTALSQLVILSIPKMRNSSGLETSIWDEGNLCTDKSKEYISEKLKENLDREYRRADCGVFYLLENLFFARNRVFELKENNRVILIKSTDQLLREIDQQIDNQTKVLPQTIFDDLVDCIYSVLHEMEE